ncbi:hypothetical protein CQA37_04500 [Helicobacter sp. MIT 99-10781]|uniref:TrbC family F-type conjugative pilus assembly protein n=1 Tax=unclassified Helicobacter TaxID=2593540 RepID=UPI000E2015B7|nr:MULTISPECIES: TrbC family F-type conjugative pilus assembly protein [unclassified Helicobacter]RDU55073.1 hypothetical protein CQA37_04500 [Helicobacter sp. MIT 99-10781]
MLVAKYKLVILALCSLCLGADFPKEEIVDTLLTKRQKEVYLEKRALLDQSKKKELTLFYMTSKSMGVEASKAFKASVKRLNDKGYATQGMIVLRGFPKDFRKYVSDLYEKDIGGELKIHPFLFRKFNLQRVPAYALAYCQSGENFSLKTCEFAYFIAGDITLSDVMRHISNKDKKYEPYYFALIGTTSDKKDNK